MSKNGDIAAVKSGIIEVADRVRLQHATRGKSVVVSENAAASNFAHFNAVKKKDRYACRPYAFGNKRRQNSVFDERVPPVDVDSPLIAKKGSSRAVSGGNRDANFCERGHSQRVVIAVAGHRYLVPEIGALKTIDVLRRSHIHSVHDPVGGLEYR